MNFYDFIEKSWKSKYIYYWITFAYGSLNLAPLITLNWHSKKFWFICIFLLIGYISLLYVVHLRRKYPKFSKNAYGILFAIDIENEEQYELINKKFVIPFQSCCEKQLPVVESQMLNSFGCKQFFKLKKDTHKWTKIAKKNHYSFIIHGKSYFGNEQEDLNCKLEIDGFFNLHDNMPYNSHLLLSYEMGSLWFQIRNIEIKKAYATTEFAEIAEQLDLVFKYILALTFLLCNDCQKANKIFLLLRNELNIYKKNIPVINDIKNVIDTRIVWSFLVLARQSLYEFYQNNDKSSLLNMKSYLDNIKKYDPNSYDAKILLGFFYFLYNRNIKDALLVLTECKNEKSLTWKQNVAFLKLYEKDSAPNFLNAYKTYKQLAMRGDLNMYNIDDVSTFIHKILDLEPEKKQLYFILFLIYHYLGDEKLENEYYSYFIEEYSEICDNDRINDMLFKMGKVDKIVEEIYSA